MTDQTDCGARMGRRSSLRIARAKRFQSADVMLEAQADHIEALYSGAWDIGHGAQIIRDQDGIRRAHLRGQGNRI